MTIPMMPKGVEHLSLHGVVIANLPVTIPMMPKGVEHAKLDDVVTMAKEV